jgi:hypothetical protein
MVQMMLGYIDIEFSIPSGTLLGAHTVRVVYATIDELGLKQGDVLYNTETGFAWWDSTKQSSGLQQSRPATQVQNRFALKLGTPDTQRGNQYIQQLSAFIPDSLQLTLATDTILAHSWSFEVDFIVNRCVSFINKNPETMTSLKELMTTIDVTANGFDIREMNGEKIGLAARVKATKQPSQ